MRQKSALSTETRSFLKLVLCFFSLAVVFRIVFYILFKETSDLPYTFRYLRKAFVMGLHFDLRAAVLLSLPFWFLGYGFKLINAVFEEKNRQMFFSNAPHPTRVLALIFSLVISFYSLFFFIDIGFYDYLQNRLDASATVFLKNPSISLEMLSQSYPLSMLGLMIVALFIFFYILISKKVFKDPIFVLGEPIFRTPLKIVIPVFLILASLSHGRLSQYPLRWSDAFFSSNNFISSLGLNPLLYFYDTFNFKDKNYDIDKVKEHYAEVADYLKVDAINKEKLSFKRKIKATDAFDSPPNVVVIMMESLASFKLQHFGQKIPGAPFLDSLISKSLFFENAYVLSTGTARSIFGVVTGLPDLNSTDTASRNPLLVKQYSAANAFDDYQKSYFIGGSAAWGNIRGFVSQSIEDVTIYEENDFKSSKTDVWGISDLKLFEEAHSFLKESSQNKNQFMFIQTAGYHRPYTIPKDKGSFQLKELSEKQIKDNGFVNNKEYNALRFSDYALSEFFKLAEKEEYFKNTLFVIYADHGLSHFSSQAVPKGFKQHRLPIMHVPLLFYSPSLKIEPKVFSKVAFAPDILPSAVSLAGKNYFNNSIGRNLFDEKYDGERYALTVSNFSPPLKIRLHDQDWISTGNVKKLKGLYPYQTEDFKTDKTAENLSKQKRMDRLARGLYETTKYLYYHSSK